MHKYVNTSLFIDNKYIKCIGGRGGSGFLGFSKHGPHRLLGPGMPIGGNGGNGGNIFAQPNNNTLNFNNIRSVIVGNNGSAGKNNNINGKNGEDVVLNLPVGTLIYKLTPEGVSFTNGDPEATDNWRVECLNWNRTLISDITSLNHERILLASGGLGGLGNNIKNPYESQPGHAPQENYYELKLKLISDIGLLGLPNVGKSTLFSNITNCYSKIGNYPFTTLAPYIGQIKYSDGLQVSVIDLPGISMGPSNAFMKHIERIKHLLLVVDVANPTHNLIESFKILRYRGLTACSDFLKEHKLADRPFSVVVTKMDILSQSGFAGVDGLQRHLAETNSGATVIPVSAKYNIGLESRPPDTRLELVLHIRAKLESAA